MTTRNKNTKRRKRSERRSIKGLQREKNLRRTYTDEREWKGKTLMNKTRRQDSEWRDDESRRGQGEKRR